MKSLEYILMIQREVAERIVAKPNTKSCTSQIKLYSDEGDMNMVIEFVS